MKKDFSLFSLTLSSFSLEEYRERLTQALQGSSVCTLHTVNPEMLVDARFHKDFAEVLAQATFCVPDGVGVSYASLALTGEILAVHPGVDTLLVLMDLAHEQRLRVAVCGAREKEHEVFRALFVKRAPGAVLFCIDPGIIDERDPHLPLPVVERLVAFAPHIVLVALGQGRGIRQGKQERVLQELAPKLSSARVVIGVGGALDMLGGRVERAPLWMRTRKLEWLYRFALQPWRFKRIVKALGVFPALVALEALRRRVFWQAVVRVSRQVFRDIL